MPIEVTTERDLEHTPEETALLAAAARRKGWHFFNPLWWIYSKMGLVWYNDAEMVFVRLCFARWNLTYYRVKGIRK